MDNLLSKALDEHTPRMNDKFVRGIAKEVFENIPAYINKMIQISMEKVNPKIDFKYRGYRICTPEEELMEDALSKAGSKPADIAQNNVYLCVFEFEYNGQIMPKYIYLPYCDPGNIFVISGTKYVVMPVLTDLVISVKPDRIFIRLHRDKIHVTSERKRVILNDNPNPEMPKLLYSSILNSGTKDNMRPGAKTPLGLYLLCKYGLKETLRRYTNVQDGQILIKYAGYEDIKPEDYPAYDIYSSVGERPKAYDRGVEYRKHKIKVLVDKKLKLDPLLTNIICGIIVSFDMVNGRVEEDIVRILANQELAYNNYMETLKLYPEPKKGEKRSKAEQTIVDKAEHKWLKEIHLEKEVWRLLLGKGMCKSTVSVEKILIDLEEHITALDSYVDEIISRKLANVGVMLSDFWDLLVYIIKIYAHSVNNAKEYNRNVNHVHIDLHYYICYYIIIGFNRSIKQINQRFEKNGQKPPSKDEIKRIINIDISEKVIYKLVKSSSASLALAQADISNDSLYYKATSQLENQNRGEGVHRGGKTPFPDNIKTLTAPMFAYGSLLYLIKAAPSPSLRANPWGQWDEVTGHVIIPPHLQPAIDKLDAALRGVTDAADVDEELKDAIEDLQEGIEKERESDDDDESEISNDNSDGESED